MTRRAALRVRCRTPLAHALGAALSMLLLHAGAAAAPAVAPAAPVADPTARAPTELVLPGGLRATLAPGPTRALLIQSAAGTVLQRWPLADGQGRAAAGPVQWLHWPARQALVVAPGELPELWEISLDTHAEDRYDGLVHDFRFGEGVPVPGFLHRRRIPLAGPVHAWAADTAGTLLVLVIARPLAGGPPLLQGWNLDARRIAARWPWPEGATPAGAPQIDEAAGLLWLPDAQGRRHRLPLTSGR